MRVSEKNLYVKKNYVFTNPQFNCNSSFVELLSVPINILSGFHSKFEKNKTKTETDRFRNYLRTFRLTLVHWNG